jgi:hypothetical protein
MGIDFTDLVYLPNYNVFARPVTFTPKASQPTAAPYLSRGIYGTEPIDVLAEEGSIFSDQRTILDVREAEFDVVPQQGDQVDIPADVGMPALGSYEIIEVKSNGGGETTLSLRKLVPAKP